MSLQTRTITALVLAAGMAFAINARAATVGQTFNVSTTFTPTCITNNASPADLNFGAYSAFGSAANAAPTTTISFKCSRAFAIVSVVFDTGTNLVSSAAGLTPTAGGVIAGLRYTLATSAVSKSVTGAAATAAVAGTADEFQYVITGTMAAGQAGCTGSGNTGDLCAATQTRTLTVSY
jgi:hypothetical protein